jgi:hypothetical protein
MAGQDPTVSHLGAVLLCLRPRRVPLGTCLQWRVHLDLWHPGNTGDVSWWRLRIPAAYHTGSHLSFRAAAEVWLQLQGLERLQARRAMSSPLTTQ